MSYSADSYEFFCPVCKEFRDFTFASGHYCWVCKTCGVVFDAHHFRRIERNK